jgi:hypothetical protein
MEAGSGVTSQVSVPPWSGAALAPAGTIPMNALASSATSRIARALCVGFIVVLLLSFRCRCCRFVVVSLGWRGCVLRRYWVRLSRLEPVGLEIRIVARGFAFRKPGSALLHEILVERRHV